MNAALALTLDSRRPIRSTLEPMTVVEDAARDQLLDEELRLARAAAAGDGEAFATLYERYEGRAFNLAFRITGSREDAADAVQDAFLGVLRRLPGHDGGDLAFGSYVFTATRNACYDLIAKRQRAQPSDSIPESATPLGGGAGGLGLDPGDPDDDPTRRQLLDSQRGEIRLANERLPERQREVLALRELEELSYDEIAAIMGMNRNSVAQLISRARLNLRAELRGAALESIPAAAPECERALPLIARRDDGELGAGEELAWLDSHLGRCDGCRLRREAMQEAGVSYRAWAPVAAAPGLFEATMAEAAELLGVDWSETVARRVAVRERAGRGERGRRPGVIAAALVVLLLAGLVTARELDNLERDAEPAVVEQVAAPVGENPERPPAEPRRAPDPAALPTTSGEASVAPPATEPVGEEPAATQPSRKGGAQDAARDREGERPSAPARQQPAANPVPAEPTPTAEPEATQPETPREPEQPAEPEQPGEPEPPPKPPTPGGGGSFTSPPPPPPVP